MVFVIVFNLSFIFVRVSLAFPLSVSIISLFQVFVNTFLKKKIKNFLFASGKIKGGFVRLLIRSVVPPAIVRILFIQSNVCVIVFIKSQLFSSLRVCYCFLQNLLGSCFVTSRKANQKIASAFNCSDYCVFNLSFFHCALPLFSCSGAFPLPIIIVSQFRGFVNRFLKKK